MAGPYQHLGIDFIPLGGLNAKTWSPMLPPLISAIGGSWIAKRDLITASNWDQIEANAREARQIVEAVRGQD